MESGRAAGSGGWEGAQGRAGGGQERIDPRVRVLLSPGGEGGGQAGPTLARYQREGAVPTQRQGS